MSLSVTRLNLLRACYLLLAVGTLLVFMPQLFSSAGLPLMHGAVNAMLSALGLLSLLGLAAPMRMLPLLLFEIIWKLLWTLCVAVPRWQVGTLDTEIIATLYACAWVIPFVLVLPWRQIFASYLRPLEPWTTAPAER